MPKDIVSIRITTDAQGGFLLGPTTKLELNGVDISRNVRAFSVSGRVGALHTIALELLPNVIELELAGEPQPGSDLHRLVGAVRALQPAPVAEASIDQG